MSAVLPLLAQPSPPALLDIVPLGISHFWARHWLSWAQISGAAYLVWGGPRQERRSALPPQLWLEADWFPGVLNLGPPNLRPSCPPLHGCIPGELLKWPGVVGRGGEGVHARPRNRARRAHNRGASNVRSPPLPPPFPLLASRVIRLLACWRFVAAVIRSCVPSCSRRS